MTAADGELPTGNREIPAGDICPVRSGHARLDTAVQAACPWLEGHRLMRPLMAPPTGPTSVAYTVPARTRATNPRVRRFPLPLDTLRPRPGTRNDFVGRSRYIGHDFQSGRSGRTALQHRSADPRGKRPTRSNQDHQRPTPSVRPAQNAPTMTATWKVTVELRIHIEEIVSRSISSGLAGFWPVTTAQRRNEILTPEQVVRRQEHRPDG